jgi:hypothetical protein
MTYLSIPRLWTHVALALAVLCGAAGAQLGFPHGHLAAGNITLAVPLSGIRIDGDLSDWPEETPRIPLRNHFQAYGPTDLDDVDLGSSDDFSPSMMVGYDDDEDLLYVAVIVRDDELHMEGDPIYRDGIEIYVSSLEDGSHPMQYRLATSRTGGGPTLRNGKISDTRADGAWRHEGDHLVYEWRLEVFDRFPGRSGQLDEGDLIGFDVVAIDNDGNGNAAWVPWGPPMRDKFASNDRVGRLLLAPAGMRADEREVLVSILEAWSDGHGDHRLHNLEGLEHLGLLGHLGNLEHLEGLGEEIEALVEQLVKTGKNRRGTRRRRPSPA